MSWDHGTYGWEKYDGFVAGLQAAAVEYVETLGEPGFSRGSDMYGEGSQALRTATFVGQDGRQMVAEEYLVIDDGDCDGSSRVAVSVYPEGERPELWTEVYLGGHQHYPEAPMRGIMPVEHFRICLGDRRVEIPETELPEPPETHWVSIPV